jgi:hypothetical protein
MRFLADVGATIPPPLLRAAEIVLNADLRAAFHDSNADPAHVSSLLAEAARFQVPLDREGLAHALSATILRVAQRLAPALTGDGSPFARYGDRERPPSTGCSDSSRSRRWRRSTWTCRSPRICCGGPTGSTART